MLRVRQKALPVSPECSVDGTFDQSVVVKGSCGIFMVAIDKSAGRDVADERPHCQPRFAPRQSGSRIAL